MHTLIRPALCSLALGLSVPVMTGISGQALAQNYPAKPLRVIVGFTPGGGVDINARLLAPRLSEALGQQVIVENKPGAGTNIATEFVARSAPDGYTILFASPGLAINMSLYKKVNFDAVRDFAPVSVFSVSPNIMAVSASVPARNLAEFLALARAQPGKLNFSSAGSGTTQHLAGELLNTLAKIRVAHVPYKGSAPSLTALISGEVQMSFANIPSISQHVKSGKVRALAMTGSRRSDQLPDVPTLKESGVNMEVEVWYGVLVPAATPRPIVQRLNAEIVKIAQSPDIGKRLVELGAEPRGSSPEEFAALIRREVTTWAAVVKASGATADE